MDFPKKNKIVYFQIAVNFWKYMNHLRTIEAQTYARQICTAVLRWQPLFSYFKELFIAEIINIKRYKCN